MRPTLLTIPNLLTAIRFPLAAAFLATDAPAVRLTILGMASASDLLDGWIARRTGQLTRAGALFDPVADKTFMLAAFTSFLVHGEMTVRDWALLLARDFATALGAAMAWLIPGLDPGSFIARVPGKVVTVLQLAAILVLTVSPALVAPTVLVVGWASIFAIADYTIVLAWTLDRRA